MWSRYYSIYTDEGTGLARVATHGNPRLEAGSSGSIICVINYNAILVPNVINNNSNVNSDSKG